ncbi:MAG: hypothetical protein PHD06_05225 [Bacteroidales bacterium]|nr:hypothetical protein [Bacteroidales bacterium]
MTKAQKIQHIKNMLILDELTEQELDRLLVSIRTKGIAPTFDLSGLTDTEIKTLSILHEKASIQGVRILHLGSGVKDE